MIVEDVKEPCVDCFHESRCTLRHPELLDAVSEDYTVEWCEKLDKHSRYIESTRNQ